MRSSLASMPEDEFVELVWENGQILMRGRSGRTQKGHSCTTPSLYPSNAEAENGGNVHTKRARLGTVCSISNDSTFSGFMGHKDSDLNFTHNNSSPNGYQFNLEAGSKSKSDYKQYYATDSQPRFARGEIPELGSSRNSSETQVSVDQHDRRRGALVYFSDLRPAALFQANNRSRPTCGRVVSKRSVDGLKGGKDESNPLEAEAEVIEPPSLQKNQPQAADLLVLPPVDVEDHSQVFGHRNHKSGDQLVGQASSLAKPISTNTAAGKPNINKFAEPPVASSSVRSLGASNDPTYSLRRTYHEDTEESAYPSEDFTREVEECQPQGLISGTGAKRSRTAQVHNFSERRRRDKINEKMRALKELIPNCNKVDKASMLDEAIEYLKTLQLQLQIMSMGSSVCMPPMMLPTMMQHMCAPHLTLFSPVGMGMGCNPGGQFPTSELPTFQMLGFPGQAFPMSVSHSPFIPLVGMPSTQSVVAPGAAPLGKHLSSGPLTPVQRIPIRNDMKNANT